MLQKRSKCEIAFGGHLKYCSSGDDGVPGYSNLDSSAMCGAHTGLVKLPKS